MLMYGARPRSHITTHDQTWNHIRDEVVPNDPFPICIICCSRLLFSESTAKILGPTEVYVKQGSTLSLTCLVTQAVENAAIFWYHDVNVLDDQTSSGRIHIDSQFDPAAGSLTSRLRIDNLRVAHSGNYSCLPTAADPAFVIVHVINGI